MPGDVYRVSSTVDRDCTKLALNTMAAVDMDLRHLESGAKSIMPPLSRRTWPEGANCEYTTGLKH